MRATVYPSFCGGAVIVPPSKSMAHRAIICACLADGVSTVRRVSESDDMRATIGAMEALGAKIERKGDTLTIHGTAAYRASPYARWTVLSRDRRSGF